MIVQISKERVEELLPQNIKDSDVISNHAKKVLAYLMNQWLVNKKAKESGYVVASNYELSVGCKINGGAVMTAVQELIEHNLVLRKAGVKRTQGQTPQASEYTILFHNLRKPLVKNNFETLFGEFCPDYTNANTNTTSNTTTNTTTNTDTTSNTNTTTNTDTHTTEHTSIEHTTTVNKYFQEFKGFVDENLVGENEGELINKRVEISNSLKKKELEIGKTMCNRCSSYLKRKFEEAVASI